MKKKLFLLIISVLLVPKTVVVANGIVDSLSPNKAYPLSKSATSNYPMQKKLTKQGMFFARAELSIMPSVYIGYGGIYQIFTHLGYGFVTNNWYANIGYRTRLVGGYKWGLGIEFKHGISYPQIGLSSGYALVFSIKNFDIKCPSIDIPSFHGYDYDVSFGFCYNFRSSKYWDYKLLQYKEQNAGRADYSKTTYRVSRPKPCPYHESSYYYNDTSLAKNIDEHNDGIVGIYEDVYSEGYRLGVIRLSDGSYKIIYLSGGDNECWKYGDYKATLRPTATPGLFKASWFTPNYKRNDNCIITFDGVQMYVSQPNWKALYLKMYPNASSDGKVADRWSGTGFAIGNNYLVTNHHVIDGANKIIIKGIGDDIYSDYTAEVVATDKKNDLAILKITDSRFAGFGAIPYNVTTRMAEVGEDVFVLGYPLTQTMGNEIKLTNGIISSRTGYQGDAALYQMTAPIQPGNSGGPMFDNKGKIVGVIVAHHAGAENAGYAIKTTNLLNLIESSGLKITMPSVKNMSDMSLSEKVKRVKTFVYLIECSK